MVEHIYNLEEFIKKTGIEQTVLDKLIEAQVIMPAGQVDGNTPYFDQNGLDAADTITKLLDIGYSLDDVIRIRRKVGIPSKGAKRHVSGMPLLTVGELAKRIDSNPRTIKHWEEKGIIEPESYTPGGFRLYPESYVKVCQYIQDLQLFGYTLDEIKVLAELVRDYLSFRKNKDDAKPERMSDRLQQMKEQMDYLNRKISLFEKGIERWRRLLRQRGKEIAILASKIGREVQPGNEPPDLIDETKKPAAGPMKPKCRQRRKS
jgi:DNA-binding transcriptional MerR regulator